MEWFGLVWYDMVWYGMVCYGMVKEGLYGMVWFGVVWDGIAWYGLLSVMAIRKEKHGHIVRPGLYNASIYLYVRHLEGTPVHNFEVYVCVFVYL